MLDGGAACFAGKLHEARLVDELAAGRLDADLAHMLQAFDQARHRGRPGGLGHLPQPRQPALARFRTAPRQGVEAPMPLDGQGVGQAGDIPPCGHRAATGCTAAPGPRPRARRCRAAGTSALPGRQGQPVVPDRLRQQSAHQFRRRASAEGAAGRSLGGAAVERAIVTAASFSAPMATGRPPRRPRRAAAASPACTRSWTRGRSSCASTPKTWNRNPPCGVVVVHLLGQRADRDAPGLERRHRGEQVRQQAAQPVQLPDHQAIAGLDGGQGLGAVAAASAGTILEQVALIGAGRQQSVPLRKHRARLQPAPACPSLVPPCMQAGQFVLADAACRGRVMP